MRLAIREASKGAGTVSPNPLVGAVIVKEGRILAKGHHERAGCPHAEAAALSKLGGKAQGATIYVNLEPCNHFGRTPPCTEAILASGIKRVVVGMRDPNPHVKGGGCDYLRAKGLEVVEGVLEEECSLLNETFIKFSLKNMPFVTLKSALTLDGWSACSTGHSRWVTGEKARRLVHRMRASSDAVMVGVGTVIADDPMLTARLGKKRRSKNPARVILDTRLRTPADANVLKGLSEARTILAVGPEADERRIEGLLGSGVEVIRCPLKGRGLDLPFLLKELGSMGITAILLEGGAMVAGSFLREGLVDKVVVFLAPKLLGGGDGIPMAWGKGPEEMRRCISLSKMSVRRIGADIMAVGYPEYPQFKVCT
jgi:diaminohydroxyphosphoribosylaminopyrimidine deaminase/5-amino-6-(5-phosphoribosylamino)uracil reductase